MRVSFFSQDSAYPTTSSRVTYLLSSVLFQLICGKLHQCIQSTTRIPGIRAETTFIPPSVSSVCLYSASMAESAILAKLRHYQVACICPVSLCLGSTIRACCRTNDHRACHQPTPPSVGPDVYLEHHWCH